MRKITATIVSLTAVAAFTGGCGTTNSSSGSQSVPEACIEALEAAQELINLAADSATIHSESSDAYLMAFESSLSGDLDSMSQASSDLDLLTDELFTIADRIEGVDWYGPKDECLALNN